MTEVRSGDKPTSTRCSETTAARHVKVLSCKSATGVSGMAERQEAARANPDQGIAPSGAEGLIGNTVPVEEDPR